MFLALIYACGLGISEATTLDVPAIDSELVVINVRGEGQKDRLVPLSEPIRKLLILSIDRCRSEEVAADLHR